MSWRRVSFFVAALIAGIAIWMAVTPLYLQGVAAIAEALIHSDARLRDVDLVAAGRFVRISPGDTTRIPSGYVPAAELTINTILLFALFASNPRPWRARNLRNFGIALLIVCALHPIFVAISVESTLAARAGAWSEQHYSALSANVFVALEMFYKIVGMYALAFACWWVGEPDAKLQKGD